MSHYIIEYYSSFLLNSAMGGVLLQGQVWMVDIWTLVHT